MKRKRIKHRFIKVLSLAVMAIPVGQTYCQSLRHRAQQEALREKRVKRVSATGGLGSSLHEAAVSVLTEEVSVFWESAVAALAGRPDPDGGSVGQPVEKPAVLKQYAALYEENKDLVGWLSIEGMKIDRPVMQCEDDEYYLYHDFYGQDSNYGSLYVREGRP